MNFIPKKPEDILSKLYAAGKYKLISGMNISFQQDYISIGVTWIKEIESNGLGCIHIPTKLRFSTLASSEKNLKIKKMKEDLLEIDRQINDVIFNSFTIENLEDLQQVEVNDILLWGDGSTGVVFRASSERYKTSIDALFNDDKSLEDIVGIDQPQQENSFDNYDHSDSFEFEALKGVVVFRMKTPYGN